jgi:hypothetical protein
VWLRLNYRAEPRFVDPSVDLAKQHHSLRPYSWLMPFERTPLPPPVDPLGPGIGRQASVLGHALAARQRFATPR